MLPYGNPFGVSVLKVADPVDATKVLDNSASVGNVDTSPAIGGDESPLPWDCLTVIHSFPSVRFVKKSLMNHFLRQIIDLQLTITEKMLSSPNLWSFGLPIYIVFIC